MDYRDGLASIRYRVWLRTILPSRHGSSVKTFVDEELAVGERILLPGKQDLPVFCFRFEKNDGRLDLIVTDKQGNEQRRHEVEAVDALRLEYYLKMRVWFLFKHEVARSVGIPHTLPNKDMFEYLFSVQTDKRESSTPVLGAGDFVAISA